MKGTIFSIEDFAINDGPGIRTTVFLKGCPLRCAWCHNPEGLSPEHQILHKAERDEVSGYSIDSKELARMLLRDKDIFLLNHGGVTFTGGEPTFQHRFLKDVLERLEGIHRAIETSGYCSEEVFRDILKSVDLVLFDLKHADPKEHKRYTGVSNEPILRNLEILKASSKPFIIRIPLIPGVNDSLKNMRRTHDLVSGARNLVRVELLRYHQTAGAKYPMLGMSYDPPFDTAKEPEVHSEVFEDLNLIIL